MGQNETTVTSMNRIMIYGPKADGTYLVEFRTAAGEALVNSVPRKTVPCVIGPPSGSIHLSE
jgi:hypothetical protein